MLTAEAAYLIELRLEREEGIEEGVKIGREKSSKEIARKARKIGLDSATIASITGLDIDTINRFPGSDDEEI
ncbi:MAG: hypothetical protein LBT86_00780 [Deltaproteobacteria bacterium]|nr:hypothetical protein [Deltaproteobacteria bacterium]